MKNKKKKSNKLLIWILVIEVVLILVLLAGILLIKPAQQSDATVPTDAAQETTVPATQSTTAPEETEATEFVPVVTEPVMAVAHEGGEIQTPYLTLYFPEALSDHLVVATVSSDPYTLGFFAALEGKRDQQLFDIALIPNAEGNLGAVTTDAGSIGVSMTLYQFQPDDSWSQGEINTVLAMQDASNEIIQQLNIVPATTATENDPVISNQSTQQATADYLVIETPYCNLDYPATWSSYLTVEQQEQDGILKVLFYGQPAGQEKQLLFSIYFGGDDGEQLGTVTNDQGVTVPVNLLFAELVTDGLSEDDEAILFGMQDDLNLLISRIPLD